MNKQHLKAAYKAFLQDPQQRKIELAIPKGFSIYWLCNPLGVGFRKVALKILSKVPPMNLKTAIFRLLGYNFKKDVCLPGYIAIDPYFPKLITLEEGVLVGGMSTLKPWVIEENKLTLGRIYVARRNLLAGWATLLPGAYLNEHVLAGMHCIIDQEIPRDSFVIKNNHVLKTWTPEEVEKFFGESKHHRHFGKEVRELTKKFRKDKSMRILTFRNDGNRLNAGCEWWRARPVWRIYYNGIFVETALLCPFESWRKLLFKMMGVKFGKNVRLGKRVTFDHIYGDMVTIEDNVIIEDGVFLDGHEYTTSETTYGKTIIEEGALLKKGCFIRGGMTIGKGAVIEENAVVMKDVGVDEIWAGAPAKMIGKKSEAKAA